MDLGAQLWWNEGIVRLPNTIVEKFVRAGKPEHESGADGLPHGRMDLFLRSTGCDRQTRSPHVVAKAGELFERFLRSDGQACQFADHEFHHVVGESPVTNLSQIPLPRRLACVEFNKVFFGEGREELDHKKWVTCSFFVHEPRQGLGAYSSTAILEDYLDQLETTERKDHLQSIRNNTRRMAGIMEEVLLLGSFDAGKMEFRPVPLELRSFVQDLVEEILSATERRCPIELSLSHMPAEIEGDERLLRHVFTNLLTNAVKYSDAGRAVRFEIARIGPEMVCAIRDQGIGIPEADREWLFNAFQRGHNVADRPGTGLGLVIVKRCVDLYRGKITVDSEIGRGTSVTVRLPISAPADDRK